VHDRHASAGAPLLGDWRALLELAERELSPFPSLVDDEEEDADA
jgi:hypothetical protein